jgi:hypothetical protein
MELHAELRATGGTTTGFEVPDDFVTALGGGGRPKVKVVVNGYEFRSSIAKMGGAYWLGMSAERRTAAGVAAGDELDLEITRDTEERTLDVPEDLALALAADPAARSFWQTLSYSKQQWHVLQVTGAKAAETRANRVRKSVQMLAGGRAR